MPPKKGKGAGKKTSPRSSEEDDHHLGQLDVQYNPEAIASILSELFKKHALKIQQIETESEFHIQSLNQMFQMELLKLPKQVKEMPVKKFKEEFGDSIEAVAKGSMTTKSGVAATKNHSMGYKENRMSHRSAGILQTPSHKGQSNNYVMQTPGNARNPREGEEILSANGSPLGEFTVKKAPKSKQMVPQTPSVYVPLKNGEVIDLDNIDVETLSEDGKADALSQVQFLMSNMQALMAKLQNPSAV